MYVCMYLCVYIYIIFYFLSKHLYACTSRNPSHMTALSQLRWAERLRRLSQSDRDMGEPITAVCRFVSFKQLRTFAPLVCFTLCAKWTIINLQSSLLGRWESVAAVMHVLLKELVSVERLGSYADGDSVSISIDRSWLMPPPVIFVHFSEHFLFSFGHHFGCVTVFGMKFCRRSYF